MSNLITFPKMRSLHFFLTCATAAIAAVVPVQREVLPSLIEERDSACLFGPLTRACWSNGFSIATDFDQKHPNTGVVVEYNLDITNGTCDPDGHGPRMCLLVNGQYPAPTITANWGDTLIVHVTSNLENNGTGFHWHGVRQLNSCGSDGVPGITECPVAPGTRTTYKMLVTQFGTSWYHSHYTVQLGDGVLGALIFNGPATANYDIDLGPYPVNDWYYTPVFEIWRNAQANTQVGRGPPDPNTILINGTNQNAAGGGQYNRVSVAQGKKYLLRLINMSVDNYIRVSLDNHTFQVITADFVPVKPFSADWILMGTGQRYDVVITANQTAGSYWFRAEVANDCGSANDFYGRAVWTYDGYPTSVPATTAAAFDANCQEPHSEPFWYQPVPSGSFQSMAGILDVGLTRAQVVPGGDTLVVWGLNSSSIDISWQEPTLSYVMTGNTSYPSRLNVIPTLTEGKWNYWLIQQDANAPPISHPIHLHGHDFFVLGQGSTPFDASTANLDWNTPTRRDTASVHGNGWLALAFMSNNPGAWLMHCHIAFHIAGGLGVQFLESPDLIVLPEPVAYNNQCAAWAAFEAETLYPKDDSGL